MAPITINGIVFDPIAEAPVLSALNLEAHDASKSNYVLVGFKSDPTTEQNAELERLGLIQHGYVANNTYLFGFKPDDLNAIRRLDYVEWANVYLKQLKINPALHNSSSESRGGQQRLLVPGLAAAIPRSQNAQAVDVMLHQDVSADSVGLQESICAAARVNLGDLTASRNKIRLSVELRYLDALAHIDNVRAILPVNKPQLHNNVALGILNADVNVGGVTYQGQGEVICVADTGFDIGSTDPARMHPAFTNRVAHLYGLGRPGSMDDPAGHGTHVCGSVLGNGFSPIMGGSIQGTAPQATLVMQSLYINRRETVGGAPNDLNDLFRPPYEDWNARVHTNSWGYGLSQFGEQLAYGANSAAFEIDQFVWEHQDMVICFSAGNDGMDKKGRPDGIVDSNQIGATAAAKNCITIGASESLRQEIHADITSYGQAWPGDFPNDPLFSDPIANNAEGMVAFSSRGPTAERRLKPDVVAPGTCILSARSRAAPRPAPTDYGRSSDPDWFFDGGTSMATPLVAGCCAVLRETQVKNGRPNPSAALIKALLINGAVNLTGQYSPLEVTAAPNNDFGFGRVNLKGSIILPGPHPDSGGGDLPPFNKGSPPAVIHVPVPSGPPNPGPAGPNPTNTIVRRLKVTLVWTDPPELNGMLQNDLDLIVIAPDGSERHGNMGTSPGFDNLNNVEQVFWEGIPPGDFQIVIRPTAIRVGSQPAAYAWRLTW